MFNLNEKIWVTTCTNSKRLLTNGTGKYLDASVMMVAIQSVTRGGPLCITERRCKSLRLCLIASETIKRACSTSGMTRTGDFPSQFQPEEDIQD